MVAPGFEPVRESFAQAQSNDPGGAQLCVYRQGKLVVDLWTGVDLVHERPYDASTLTIVMSCTKGATAICAHHLAQSGALDLEAPVSRYWPEFAVNGKSAATVAHLLSHTVGLPTFPSSSGVGVKDLGDWDRCTKTLAAAAPLWEPGRHASYHAVTYGFLVGEVIRRITGLSLGAYFSAHVAEPLGLDFWIGLPDIQQPRVAPHLPRPIHSFRDAYRSAGVDVDHPIMAEILTGFDAIADTVNFINTPEGRSPEIPAANGVTNAHSLARMYAACIGTMDGVRLLRDETVQNARISCTKNLESLPPLAHLPRPPGEGFGLGFELPNGVSPMLGLGSFGHTGAGGRLGFAHPESGIAVGYACNSMLWDNVVPDPRWSWLVPLKEIAGT